MGAVTYPDETVAAALADGFEGIKLNLTERHPDFRELTANARVLWAPTFVYQDAKGRELRRRTGWLAPADFAAELAFVRAMAQMHGGKFEEARHAFQELARAFPEASVAPEALFWAGSSAYLGSGRDMSALKTEWDELLERHPGNNWAMGASTIEDWEG